MARFRIIGFLLFLFATALFSNTTVYAQQKLTITRIYDVTAKFDTTKLSKRAKFTVRFAAGGGKYAFDEGKEEWYQKSKLVRDEFYKPFGANYVAPWKFVSVGSSDQVEAIIAGGTNIDRSKVKFVLTDGTGVAATDDGTKWTLTVASTEANKTYDIFAVYEKNKSKLLTVGKLRVVSYAKQQHSVTLVPVGVNAPDTQDIETKLNAIYAPYGVEFTVNVDDAIKDHPDWSKTFDLTGSGFFSKESRDMKALRKLYQQQAGYKRDGYYLFVLDKANASNEPDASLSVQGDMPRGQQFGYIFTRGINDISRLVAHELGHGVFTLEHSFHNNYSGESGKGRTSNLMDYANGSSLASFQWNILNHPAPLTFFDSNDDNQYTKSIKKLATPILFARSQTQLGKDNTGQVKEDLKQTSLTAGQKQLFADQLLQTTDHLYEQLNDLANTFSIGKGEDNTRTLVRYFRNNKRIRSNEPNVFQNEYMNNQLDKNKLVDNFFTQGQQSVLGLFRSYIVDRKNIDSRGFPLIGKIESSRPIFNGITDMFVSGMTFAVHDISSFEVFITGFQISSDTTYDVEFKLIVYDHFGLDYADIVNLDSKAKVLFYDNFKAWYVLQHNRGYMPFITKMECTRRYINQKI